MLRRTGWRAAIVAAVAMSTGCAESAKGGDDTDYAACVDRINGFRETEGLAPLGRRTADEGCADGQAAADGASGEFHGAFGACAEAAQNECPDYADVAGTLGVCLDLMWAEGPGEDFEKHGHYLNMSSTEYTEVACGFATTAEGTVWAVQDFF
jgi:hypothetical protein